MLRQNFLQLLDPFFAYAFLIENFFSIFFEHVRLE